MKVMKISSHNPVKIHICPTKGHKDCSRIFKFSDWGRKHSWFMWLIPIVGLISLAWFLIRVIPKPSRAAYPCQRLAAPLASGFVLWITSLIGSTIIYRRAGSCLQKSRYVPAGICAVIAVAVIWTYISVTGSGPVAAQSFRPAEAVNSPIGIAKGINPGRVVWIRDADATSWDGITGNWWDNANTDQSIVSRMMSDALCSLTGCQTDKQAWDALFKYFNRTGDSGSDGYKTGEKVVIKINANQDRSPEWGKGRSIPSPHVVCALMEQLIKNAGVPGEDITIYDATQGRNIGNPIYLRIRAGSDSDFQKIKFVAGTGQAMKGRTGPVFDRDNPVKFSRPDLPTAYLPKCVTGAKYMINLALLRPHNLCGVTLSAKNHYGSVYFPNDGGWVPRALHRSSSSNNPMGSYNNLVDLIGHKHLGGKTLLYIFDALYTGENNESNVFCFQSLGDDWASSLLVSQDPVAIDSVGLDILRSEPRAIVRGNADNYLHEAAQANAPPSGVNYDPEGDSTKLESLGVHEHWNNPRDKKYSRNLGIGNGIELIFKN